MNISEMENAVTSSASRLSIAKTLALYLVWLKAGTEIIFYFAASVMVALFFKEIYLNFALAIFVVLKIIENLNRVKTKRGEIFGK